MKITKRQLKRIVKEQYDSDVHAGWDDEEEWEDDWRWEPEQRQYQEYEKWARESGHITPGASSVIATYFVEQGLTHDEEHIDTIAAGYRIDTQDVMREIERQQAEQSAMTEGKKMRITKRQLRRIIKEAFDKDFFVDREANPHDGGMYGEPEGGWMGAEEDKSVEVWEAVQQNVEEPSFAAWLGEELGSGPDPEYVMDAVQQNLNNQDFVVWLYDELGLGEY